MAIFGFELELFRPELGGEDSDLRNHLQRVVSYH